MDTKHTTRIRELNWKGDLLCRLKWSIEVVWYQPPQSRFPATHFFLRHHAKIVAHHFDANQMAGNWKIIKCLLREKSLMIAHSISWVPPALRCDELFGGVYNSTQAAARPLQPIALQRTSSIHLCRSHCSRQSLTRVLMRFWCRDDSPGRGLACLDFVCLLSKRPDSRLVSIYRLLSRTKVVPSRIAFGTQHIPLIDSKECASESNKLEHQKYMPSTLHIPTLQIIILTRLEFELYNGTWFCISLFLGPLWMDAPAKISSRILGRCSELRMLQEHSRNLEANIAYTNCRSISLSWFCHDDRHVV